MTIREAIIEGRCLWSLTEKEATGNLFYLVSKIQVCPVTPMWVTREKTEDLVLHPLIEVMNNM